MATKVTIIGEKPKTEKKKKIQFLKHLSGNENNTFETTGLEPKHFYNIELICKNYNVNGEDLMFAYDSDRNSRLETFLIIGHFNDGVV